MENLIKFFPFIQCIFSFNGITMSEAQRRKEANKNNFEALEKELKGEIYSVTSTYITASGVHETTEDPQVTILPGRFEKILGDTAKLKAENAHYGVAIKMKDELKKLVKELSEEQVGEVFGIKKEVEELPAIPSRKLVFGKDRTIRSIEDYSAIDSAEKLLIHASVELINAVGQNVFTEAIQYEALASTIGKQAVHKGSFLRTLMNAPEIVPTVTVSAGDNIIEKQSKKLFYDKNLYGKTAKEMEKKYTEYQKERNYRFALIKDTAEKLQKEYDDNYILEEKLRTKILNTNSEKEYIYESQIASAKRELLNEVANLKIIEFK